MLQYLGADDQWHDTEGDPLAMSDVLKARDRSIEERTGSTFWQQPAVVVQEAELSIEDARKVARLVRTAIAQGKSADATWVPAWTLQGAARALAEAWPHLDWEVRGGEIEPFAQVTEEHRKLAGEIQAARDVPGVKSHDGRRPEIEIRISDDAARTRVFTGATLEEAWNAAMSAREERENDGE